MGSTKRARFAFAVPLGLLASLPVPAIGAEWGGGVTAGLSRTDNVFLSSSPDEIDDLIYRASPYINFNHASASLDARMNYRYEYYKYDDIDTTSSYHIGDAAITGKAFNNALQVELGALRNQVISNPDETIPGGRLPLAGNLTDRDEYWINPRFSQRLGSAVSMFTQYRYSEGSFDDPRFQDDTNQFAYLKFDNYSTGQGLTWALSYEWRRTDYDFSPTWEYQNAKAELGYWISSATRIFGAYGVESPFDMPFEPDPTEPYWEAGFSHTAGENLSAEFAGGERGFGTSWRGTLDYSFRRGNTTLSYVETPMTIGFNSSNSPIGTAGPPAPAVPRTGGDADEFDDFLNRPGTAERFLSKRLEWSLDLRYRKSSFGISAFDEDRSQRTSATGAQRGDQKQTGVRLRMSVDLGVRTELSLSGSVSDQELGAGNKSRLTGAQIGVDYRLGARSDVSLNYRYDQQKPRDDSTSSRNYTAGIVSLLFTYGIGERSGAAPPVR